MNYDDELRKAREVLLKEQAAHTRLWADMHCLVALAKLAFDRDDRVEARKLISNGTDLEYELTGDCIAFNNLIEDLDPDGEWRAEQWAKEQKE